MRVFSRPSLQNGSDFDGAPIFTRIWPRNDQQELDKRTRSGHSLASRPKEAGYETGGTVSFFRELKRRKVFRVAIAYAIVAWLLAQVAATTFPILLLPEWLLRALVIVLLLGFPLALVLAWAFEVKPEATTLTGGAEVSMAPPTVRGRKSNYLLVGAATLALGLLLGGLLGRVTVDVPEPKDIVRTPIRLTANPQTTPASRKFLRQCRSSTSASVTSGALLPHCVRS